MGLTVQANFYCFMFFTTAIHTDLLLSIDAFYCFWSFCFLLCKILSISIDFFSVWYTTKSNMDIYTSFLFAIETGVFVFSLLSI
jgi:hypothetical protein